MTSIEEFIEKSNKASNAEEAFHLFSQTLSEMGFDRVVYSLLTDHFSLQKKAGHGIAYNYPDDWMKYYAEKGYDTEDPVPKQAFKSSRPFSWEGLTKTSELTALEQKVMNEAEEAGLKNGVGIPLYGAHSEIAGVGLASSTGGIDIDQNTLCKLRAISSQFHMIYSDFLTVETSVSNVRLTPREREILLWVSEGKSDPVISEIIGISIPTVRFHLNNIYQKLQANERTFAVVKALHLGLISPSIIAAPYQT
ncbi:MAG: LuxR family transcriptional regulator [Rhodospirillales bacterium]|nr:LuxR family transcriptional regulator [Rhodospirillales bacterium]